MLSVAFFDFCDFRKRYLVLNCTFVIPIELFNPDFLHHQPFLLTQGLTNKTDFEEHIYYLLPPLFYRKHGFTVKTQLPSVQRWSTQSSIHLSTRVK